MVRIPPYLQSGDTIGLVCPSGFLARDRAQRCIEVIQSWGFNTIIGKTLGDASENYFSGTDRQRLDDLQRMLDDESVRAIFCARGGYGLSRIIDRIEFKKFEKAPKWIIGYSDVTLLHAHIYANFNIATLHAPMASAFEEDASKNIYVQSLRRVLEGTNIKYSCAVHPFNVRGEAVGELIGGNLTLLAHLVGTASQPKTKGRILFLEDVGEYLYNVDRMMYQLKRAGMLDRLAGLIVGGFTAGKDTERPFGKSEYEIISDLTKHYKYPICYGFPVGHGKANYALKIGVGYKLKITKSKVSLEQ